MYVGGYLGRDDYRSLREDHAIGDVATVFFRADGSWRDIRVNARATGPGLDRLRRVPRRVCVVSGVLKLASLRAAIAAELITDVVLDEGWRGASWRTDPYGSSVDDSGPERNSRIRCCTTAPRSPPVAFAIVSCRS